MFDSPIPFIPRPLTDTAQNAGFLRLMDDTHQQANAMLEQLLQFPVDLAIEENREQLHATMKRIALFFNHHMHHHQADEEAHIYPRLVSSSDAQLVRQARDLLAEHVWLEEAWVGIHALMQSAILKVGQVTPHELYYAIEVFVQMFKEHMAQEEHIIFPEVHKCVAQQDAEHIGHAIQQRNLLRDQFLSQNLRAFAA